MPLENPWYIGSNARHRPNQQRLLANIASEGQEGVLQPTHLAVVALDTPGAGISAFPGGYAVLANHQGGQYETYVGKVASQNDIGPNGDGIVPVSATTSSGSRTDLVVLVIKDPYVTGTGSWLVPDDPENGPYAEIVIIPGVPANTNSVKAVEPNWSAITLARITRPASINVVEQSHITDLRSLIDLEGQRLVIIENPPAAPPPIAEKLWTESRKAPGTNDLGENQHTFIDWPSAANWQVPIPVWATGADVYFVAMNPHQHGGHVSGETRISIDGSVGFPTPFNFDSISSSIPNSIPVMCTGTIVINSNSRGKIVTVKIQGRQYDRPENTGYVRIYIESFFYISINFKRNPIYG